MIYSVTIQAPAINETVVLSADSEEAAKSLATGSAVNRWIQQASVTVTEAPTGATPSELPTGRS